MINYNKFINYIKMNQKKIIDYWMNYYLNAIIIKYLL